MAGDFFAPVTKRLCGLAFNKNVGRKDSESERPVSSNNSNNHLKYGKGKTMQNFRKKELIRCYRENKQDRCKECRLPQPATRLPNGIEENIEALVDNVLDPARRKYGKAITVNSGFRCPLHNQTVGGAYQSQHVKGEAADITAGLPGENLKLARIIATNGKWDQMILYVNSADSLEPRFVHVSWKKDGGNRRVILKQVRGTSGYQKVNICEFK